MKTCEDCIHQKVCILYDAIDYGWEELDSGCRFFKDKSKFIEKPFDIRDKIYIITKYSRTSPYEIIECTVTKMKLKNDATITFSCAGYYGNNRRYNCGNFIAKQWTFSHLNGYNLINKMYQTS